MEESPNVSSHSWLDINEDRLTNLSDCVLLPIKLCGIQWRNLWKHLPTHSLTSSPSHLKQDRLSNLPDCILLHILSSLNIKQVIHTCILAKRWRNLWKHLPSLSLSLNPAHFTTIEGFSKFVSQILLLRDASTSLHTLKLHYMICTEHRVLFERILKYAVSHNVQHLQILGNYDFNLFRSCFASCHTLTSLSLFIIRPDQKIIFPNSLKLPALTSLDISNVIFPDGVEPFSGYPKLSTLTISRFQILGEQNLCLSSTTLLELNIHSYINNNKIKLSTPTLSILSLRGVPFQLLPGSNLSYVKQVYIDAYIVTEGNFVKPCSDLLSWFLELTNIKSLIVSSNTLEALSLVPDVLKVEFPSLCNLKILEVANRPVSYGLSNRLIDTKLTIDSLLQNSPSPKVRFIKFIPKRNIDDLLNIVWRKTQEGEQVGHFLWQDEQ